MGRASRRKKEQRERKEDSKMSNARETIIVEQLLPSGSVSDDGEYIGITVKDLSGKEYRINLPVTCLGQLLMMVQFFADGAKAKRLAIDPSNTGYPLGPAPYDFTPERFEVGQTLDEQQMILRLIRGGMNLTVQFATKDGAALRDLLSEALKGPPRQ